LQTATTEEGVIYRNKESKRETSQTERSLKHAIGGALLVTVLIGATGCEQKGPMEKAADKVDESAEEAADAIGDAAREAADEASDAAEEAKEEVEEKTDK